MDDEEQMLYGGDSGGHEVEQSNDIPADSNAENNSNDHVSL